jgi:hypothetical protein
MLSAVVDDSASFSTTARGETMTRAEAGELINGALTGNPAAIKNLIAGEISAKMTWHDPNKKP